LEGEIGPVARDPVVIGVVDAHHRDPCFPRFADRNLYGEIRGHGPEAIAGVDHRCCGPLLRQHRCGGAVDEVRLELGAVELRAVDAVGGNPPPVRRHQNLSHEGGVVRARARRNQTTADEVLQLRRGDVHVDSAFYNVGACGRRDQRWWGPRPDPEARHGNADSHPDPHRRKGPDGPIHC